MIDPDRVGWFADRSDSAAPFNWVAVLQLPGMCFQLDGPYFSSESDCLEFIREEIIGRGML